MSKPSSPVLNTSNGLSNGLVRGYTFHEGSGQTLHDLSVEGCDATSRSGGSAANADWRTDQTYGPYVTFNGIDQDATANDAGLPTGASPRTVAWLARASEMPNSTYGYYLDFLFGYGQGGNSAFSAGLGSYGNGDNSLRIRFTTPGYGTGGTSDLRDGQVHLCAVTIVPGGLLIYKDGVQEAVVDSASATPTTDPVPISLNTNLVGTLFLGRIAGGENFFFRGDVFGILAWDRALSPSEHASLADDPWQMFRASAPALTVTPNPGTVTNSDGTLKLTPILSGGSGPISVAKVSGGGSVAPASVDPGDPVTFTRPPGAEGSATLRFSAGGAADVDVTVDYPGWSGGLPYGHVFGLGQPGYATARARAIGADGQPHAGFDWSTVGVLDVGGGEYWVSLSLPADVPLCVQCDDGAGGVGRSDAWTGAGPGMGGGGYTGPTLQAIVEGVCTRAARPTDPRNSLGGAIDSAPTEVQFDAKLQAKAAAAIAATAASLPPTPPAAYATAAGVAAAKASADRVSGLVETVTVGGQSVDRFKSAALASLLLAVVDGEPLAQILRIVRAEAAGEVDLVLVPGSAIYKAPTGAEVFRGVLGSGANGRHDIVVAVVP